MAKSSSCLASNAFIKFSQINGKPQLNKHSLTQRPELFQLIDKAADKSNTESSLRWAVGFRPIGPTGTVQDGTQREFLMQKTLAVNTETFLTHRNLCTETPIFPKLDKWESQRPTINSTFEQKYFDFYQAFIIFNSINSYHNLHYDCKRMCAKD